MSHRATESFWEAYSALPKSTQKLADKAFARLRANPRHPSLQLKKIGQTWSAHVSMDHGALAIEDDDGLTWIWIGSHAEYDKLVK